MSAFMALIQVIPILENHNNEVDENRQKACIFLFTIYLCMSLFFNVINFYSLIFLLFMRIIYLDITIFN